MVEAPAALDVAQAFHSMLYKTVTSNSDLATVLTDSEAYSDQPDSWYASYTKSCGSIDAHVLDALGERFEGIDKWDRSLHPIEKAASQMSKYLDGQRVHSENFGQPDQPYIEGYMNMAFVLGLYANKFDLFASDKEFEMHMSKLGMKRHINRESRSVPISHSEIPTGYQMMIHGLNGYENEGSSLLLLKQQQRPSGTFVTYIAVEARRIDDNTDMNSALFVKDGSFLHYAFNTITGPRREVLRSMIKYDPEKAISTDDNLYHALPGNTETLSYNTELREI